MIRFIAAVAAACSIATFNVSLAGADTRPARGGHLLGPDAGKAGPIAAAPGTAPATTLADNESCDGATPPCVPVTAQPGR